MAKPTKEDLEKAMDACLCEDCIGIMCDRKPCLHARITAVEFVKARIDGANLMQKAVLDKLNKIGNETTTHMQELMRTDCKLGVMELSSEEVCGYEVQEETS